MIIIGLVAQKGGTGKPTISRALAIEWAKAGYKVRLADCDQQQNTIVNWYRTRTENGWEPLIEVTAYQSIEQCLKDRTNYYYDLVIIDTPARTSQGTLWLAKKASLLIQPTSASRDDLIPALSDYDSLVQAGIKQPKLVFALNHLGNQTEESNLRELITAAGYQVLNSFLPEKPSFRLAQNQGKSITEVSYRSVQKKVGSLLAAIKELINDEDEKEKYPRGNWTPN